MSPRLSTRMRARRFRAADSASEMGWPGAIASRTVARRESVRKAHISPLWSETMRRGTWNAGPEARAREGARKVFGGGRVRYLLLPSEEGSRGRMLRME